MSEDESGPAEADGSNDWRGQDWGESEDEGAPRRRWRDALRSRGPQVGRGLDATERSLLSILRTVALIAAACLIIAALVLLVLGLIAQLRSPDGVEASPVQVGAADLASLPDRQPAQQQRREGAEPPRWGRVLPAEFRTPYYQLYRSAFGSSNRGNEAPLSEVQFFQMMFPNETLDQIEFFNDNWLAEPEGNPSDRNESRLRPILARLLDSVTGASRQNSVRRELAAYKAAQRVEVCRDVLRTRTRWIEQWDYTSTSCAYWSEPPYGCMGRRQISEPYRDRVCAMQFPGELANPAQIMKQLQDRYFTAVDEKIMQSQREAELRRQEIARRNMEGRESVWHATLAFLAFLGLMFLYLLVAMERHHRAISTRLVPREAPPEAAE